MVQVYVSAAGGAWPSGYYTFPEVYAAGREVVGVNANGTAVNFVVTRSTSYLPGTYSHGGANVDGRIDVVAALPDQGPPPPPP